jgi:hypothetical protein
VGSYFLNLLFIIFLNFAVMAQQQKSDPLDDYVDSDLDGETPRDEAEVNKLLGDDPMDTDPPADDVTRKNDSAGASGADTTGAAGAGNDAGTSAGAGNTGAAGADNTDAGTGDAGAGSAGTGSGASSKQNPHVERARLQSAASSVSGKSLPQHNINLPQHQICQRQRADRPHPKRLRGQKL